ncbi:hypothetical protein VP01_3502g5 [Puccinia sorghi]|uniref:Uncharacterized protein n=1 Tax=Puccinia sorghi TaxID=27349 RepID=A0A0L6UWH0_9BASI|nr:hypothetical protein VP01_3502g5 [Puccinia sorghi]
MAWLKIEWNYNACFRTRKAPAVGCPAKVEINSFEMMSMNLQNQPTSKINLTPRFRLTDKDQKLGISTINEKLESMFPTIIPQMTDKKTTTSFPSEPAENEIRSSEMEHNIDSVCISTCS